MQQQSGMKENATSNTQSSAKETDKENYLTEEHEIPNTPFMIRRVEDKWFVTIGDYRLTEPEPTRKDAEIKLSIERWHIILKLIMIAVDKLSKTQNNDNDNNLE